MRIQCFPISSFERLLSRVTITVCHTPELRGSDTFWYRQGQQTFNWTMYNTPRAADPRRDLDLQAPGAITRCLYGATLQQNRHRGTTIIPMLLTTSLETLILILPRRTISGKYRYD